MSGLKVVFFFPLLPEEDIIKVVVDFFLFRRGGEAGKKGFQPMRKKLGEKFGVVFSFAVVVTDTELFPRPSVVVVSRAPTPSLFGASTAPFTGGGAGPMPFAANPPTAQHPRSDTCYLPGFTSETDPKAYWVQRCTAAAAAQETPSMEALITTITGFLAEI